MIISFVIAIIIVILDQLTKYLIYGTPAKSIIGNLLWFQSTLNTGVAFSMFENMIWLFTAISSIAVVVFVYLIASDRFIKLKSQKIILGIILGGTFGNLIDRIVFKGVRDFIYLKFIDFAIFNVADMAVSLGAIAFCIFLMVCEIKNNKKNKKSVNIDENSAKIKKNDENIPNKDNEQC